MKAAVIGTGRMAQQHLACLKSLPGVEVAAVVDVAPGLAQSVAERFGVAAAFTDHRKMLEEVKPHVVHVVTPPATHFALAMDALAAGAHVFVEKPITMRYDELVELRQAAEERGRVLLEDHNYLFNRPVQKILDRVKAGDFGRVMHVEVVMCLDILGAGSPFVDPRPGNPWPKMPGGAICDFLPHLAYLACAFVGGHREARTAWAKHSASSPLPSDEFRALIQADHGTAELVFSAHAQPDVFWLRVYGTKMRATANLYESRLTIDRSRPGPRALTPMLNGLSEAAGVSRAVVASVWRKFRKGPGPYEGLWELLRRTYAALAAGAEAPISLEQIDRVNCLVAALLDDANRLCPPTPRTASPAADARDVAEPARA